MVMTADELAAKYDMSSRRVTAVCRASGIAPLHYVKQGSRMVPVFEDDVLDRMDDVSTFGQVAKALGTDAKGLARAIMAHYPGGALGVPHRLRQS
jgi:hypothetical protein